jgi:hypothetical protein
LGEQLPIGEILVAFSNDPVLAIWQAMKHLSEVNARTDAADISKILAEAETMLFGLIQMLIKRPEIAETVLATAAEGRVAQ